MGAAKLNSANPSKGGDAKPPVYGIAQASYDSGVATFVFARPLANALAHAIASEYEIRIAPPTARQSVHARCFPSFEGCDSVAAVCNSKPSSAQQCRSAAGSCCAPSQGVRDELKFFRNRRMAAASHVGVGRRVVERVLR